MSALVDIWTSEQAKLRNKGQATVSSGSAPTSPGASQVNHEEEERNSLGLLSPIFAKLVRFKLPPTMYSEASVSLLVEWFSA
ncbi:unnamed protein product [Ilex paraguariensis]|uniref:Uncharacterized protein n=1 Tax=Ilex paraguariensis TaxID=185542 RepID=A0ABC8S3M1_9AQUA